MDKVSTKKANKYTYYKVIQEFTSEGWEDSDFHETMSDFTFKDQPSRLQFKENLKAYHENAACAIRVIKKRELNTEAI